MMGLNNQQLEIMMNTYKGFKDIHITISRVKEDVKRYKSMLENGPVYVPAVELEKISQA